MISLSFSLYVTGSFWRYDLSTPCCGDINLLGVGLVFAAAEAEVQAELPS
jgi:hypothetical protein